MMHVKDCADEPKSPQLLVDGVEVLIEALALLPCESSRWYLERVKAKAGCLV